MKLIDALIDHKLTNICKGMLVNISGRRLLYCSSTIGRHLDLTMVDNYLASHRRSNIDISRFESESCRNNFQLQ